MTEIKSNWQKYKLPIDVLVLVELLDVFTTLIGFRLGAVEANPYLSSPVTLLIKLAVVIMVVLWFLLKAKEKQSWQMWGLSGLFVSIPVWNIAVIVFLINV